MQVHCHRDVCTGCLCFVRRCIAVGRICVFYIKMKKVLPMQMQKSLLAAALMSLFLAACGGQKTEAPAPAPASEVAASEAAPVVEAASEAEAEVPVAEEPSDPAAEEPSAPAAEETASAEAASN